jgi:hypothetical protein
MDRHGVKLMPAIGQLKVMSAIERCRTAALGGHVMRCENAALSAAPFLDPP